MIGHRALHVIALALTLALTACGPATTTLYYKQGMVFSSNQRDYDDCKIASLQNIPQNMVTQYNPGTYSPGKVICRSNGPFTQCKTRGDMNIPPSSYTYDTNNSLRTRFIGDCMAQKGYHMVELPNCPSGQLGYNSLIQAPPVEQLKCFDTNSPRLDQ